MRKGKGEEGEGGWEERRKGVRRRRRRRRDKDKSTLRRWTRGEPQA